MIISEFCAVSVFFIILALSSKSKKIKDFVIEIKVLALYYFFSFYCIGNGLVSKLWLKQINYEKKCGYVAVVTGGGRGLGASIVRGLLKCDMTVIIGARNPIKCQNFINSLKKSCTESKIDIMTLDLSKMNSVREFAKNVLDKYENVNILVNNAGVIFGGYEETEDGFESKIAINYLGHVLLTHLLLPSLERAGETSGAKSRIVNVSSIAHAITNINLEDIHMKERYIRHEAYGHSKLAQLMFSRYLNSNLSQMNSQVISIAVHPGVVGTDMSVDWKETPLPVSRVLLSEKDGARNVLFCCLNPGFVGGEYIYNDYEGFSTKESKNVDKQKSLFKLSCKMLEINDFYKFQK